MSVKQVIVVRKDLNLSPSKLAIHASHVAMCFLTEQLHHGVTRVVMKSEEAEWINKSFKKVCLQVENDHELLRIAEVAKNKKIKCYMAAEKTEDGQSAVPVCLALGPDASELLDSVVAGLKEYDA